MRKISKEPEMIWIKKWSNNLLNRNKICFKPFTKLSKLKYNITNICNILLKTQDNLKNNLQKIRSIWDLRSHCRVRKGLKSNLKEKLWIDYTAQESEVCRELSLTLLRKISTLIQIIKDLKILMTNTNNIILITNWEENLHTKKLMIKNNLEVSQDS